MQKKIILFIFCFICNSIESQCYLEKSDFVINDSILSQEINNCLNKFQSSNYYVDIVEIKIPMSIQPVRVINRTVVKIKKKKVLCRSKNYNSRIRVKRKKKYIDIKELDLMMNQLEKGSFVYNCSNLSYSHSSTIIFVKYNSNVIFSLLNTGSSDLTLGLLKNYQVLKKYLNE